MYITTNYTQADIEHIATYLTPEGKAQAELYGIYHGIQQFLSESASQAHEIYQIRLESLCVRSTGTPVGVPTHPPVALAGISWTAPRCTQVPPGDYVWFVLTSEALDYYPHLSRLVKQWLKQRPRDLVALVPSISTNTLKMIKKWGFRTTATILRDNIEHEVLLYQRSEG